MYVGQFVLDFIYYIRTQGEVVLCKHQQAV
jgi:hypothetical protein